MAARPLGRFRGGVLVVPGGHARRAGNVEPSWLGEVLTRDFGRHLHKLIWMEGRRVSGADDVVEDTLRHDGGHHRHVWIRLLESVLNRAGIQQPEGGVHRIADPIAQFVTGIGYRADVDAHAKPEPGSAVDGPQRVVLLGQSLVKSAEERREEEGQHLREDTEQVPVSGSLGEAPLFPDLKVTAAFQGPTEHLLDGRAQVRLAGARVPGEPLGIDGENAPVWRQHPAGNVRHVDLPAVDGGAHI